MEEFRRRGSVGWRSLGGGGQEDGGVKKEGVRRMEDVKLGRRGV